MNEKMMLGTLLWAGRRGGNPAIVLAVHARVDLWEYDMTEVFSCRPPQSDNFWKNTASAGDLPTLRKQLTAEGQPELAPKWE